MHTRKDVQSEEKKKNYIEDKWRRGYTREIENEKLQITSVFNLILF